MSFADSCLETVLKKLFPVDGSAALGRRPCASRAGAVRSELHPAETLGLRELLAFFSRYFFASGMVFSSFFTFFRRLVAFFGFFVAIYVLLSEIAPGGSVLLMSLSNLSDAYSATGLPPRWQQPLNLVVFRPLS